MEIKKSPKADLENKRVFSLKSVWSWRWYLLLVHSP